MATLAELTIALTEKDSDRSGILEELSKLKEIKAKGIQSNLHVTVTGVDGLSDSSTFTTLDYQLVGSSSEPIIGKEPSEVVQFEISSEIEFVDITTHFHDPFTSQSSQYSGRLVLSSIPTTSSPGLQELKIEALNVETHAAITLILNASLESIDTLIGHKIDELAGKEQELSEIKSKLVASSQQSAKAQEVAKAKSPKASTTSTKKKAASSSTTPKKGKAKSSDKDGDSKVTKSAGIGALISQYLPLVQNYGMLAVGFAVHHRAYFAFAMASVGVYLYGDQLSV